MKRFWYTLLILVIIVIAAFLISPYFIGRSVQKAAKNNFSATQTSLPFLDLSIKNYQRHWFSSEGQLAISGPKLPAAMSLLYPTPPSKNTAPIIVHFTVNHGPWVTATNKAGESKLHFAKGSILLSSDTPELQGTASTLFKIGGAEITHAHIQKLELNNANVTLHDLSMALTNRPSTNQYTLKTNTQSLQLTFPLNSNTKTTLNINQYQFDMTGKKILPYLWTGVTVMSAEKIATTVGEVPISTLKNVTLTSDAALNATNKLSINTTLSIDQLHALPLNYTISPITMTFSLSGLAANGMNTVLGALATLQKTQSPMITLLTDQTLRTGLMAIYDAGFSANLTRLHIGLPDMAPIDGSFQFTLAPTNSLSSTADAKKPVHFLEKISSLITLHLQTTVPKQLVLKILQEQYSRTLAKSAARGIMITHTPGTLSQQALAILIKNNLLIPSKNDTFLVTLHYAKDTFTINGHTIDQGQMNTIEQQIQALTATQQTTAPTVVNTP